MSEPHNKFDWGLLVAIVLPLIALLPTLGDGIVAGADVEVHVHRIHAMNLALQQGTLWPRWISYLHVGYGYPIFNYYAPGYVYITALLELAGLHITTAYNLVQSAAWMFGSAGIYLLTRRFLPVPAAILSAALWAYAPSRLYEVWWQGSLAQIVAASLIPYLLLGVIKNAAEPGLRRILAIALPFAALILSHTPMMYISALYAAPLAFFAPLWITRAQAKATLQRWLYIGAGFALGIGLAAIFLMPTLLELQYVLISQGIDETFNYLVAQFLPVSEIFTLPRRIDITDMYLDFPRTLGLVGGLLSALGILSLVRRKQMGLLLLSIGALAFTLFMLVDESLFLWLAIPGFENLRFPARLLRMGAVIVGLLGGASVLLAPKRWHFPMMLLGIVLVVAQIMPIIKPYDTYLNWENISALDEIEHELEDRTWGTVSYDEFNPIWGRSIFWDRPTEAERYIDEPFHIRVFGRDIAATNWQGLQEEQIADHILRVTTDEDRAVRFRQYYFPGWEVTVNGEVVDAYPDDQVGLITVDLPAGEHIVTLHYRGTTVQQIATGISLLSVLITIVLFIVGKDPTKPDYAEENITRQQAGLILAAIIGFAALNQAVLQPNNFLKIQSSPLDPAYMATDVNSTFGEAITLLGYTLQAERISESEPLALDLYWHVPDGVEDNYRPRVQLVNLTQSEAWAVSEPIQPAAGETSQFAPDRFARDPHILRLFNEDIPAYVGQISIQMIAPDGTPLRLPDGTDRLLLPPTIAINTPQPQDSLEVMTDVIIGDVARLRCVTTRQQDDTINILLRWEILDTTTDDLVVMVHGRNDKGEVIENGDGAPFGGDYPSYYWRKGQILDETRQLPNNPAMTTIALALYTREDVQRLPITGDTPTPDNQFVVPINGMTCSR